MWRWQLLQRLWIGVGVGGGKGGAVCPGDWGAWMGAEGSFSHSKHHAIGGAMGKQNKHLLEENKKPLANQLVHYVLVVRRCSPLHWCRALCPTSAPHTMHVRLCRASHSSSPFAGCCAGAGPCAHHSNTRIAHGLAWSSAVKRALRWLRAGAAHCTSAGPCAPPHKRTQWAHNRHMEKESLN